MCGIFSCRNWSVSIWIVYTKDLTGIVQFFDNTSIQSINWPYMYWPELNNILWKVTIWSVNFENLINHPSKNIFCPVFDQTSIQSKNWPFTGHDQVTYLTMNRNGKNTPIVSINSVNKTVKFTPQVSTLSLPLKTNPQLTRKG